MLCWVFLKLNTNIMHFTAVIIQLLLVLLLSWWTEIFIIYKMVSDVLFMLLRFLFCLCMRSETFNILMNCTYLNVIKINCGHISQYVTLIWQWKSLQSKGCIFFIIIIVYYLVSRIIKKPTAPVILKFDRRLDGGPRTDPFTYMKLG